MKRQSEESPSNTSHAGGVCNSTLLASVLHGRLLQYTSGIYLVVVGQANSAFGLWL
jgi:hypothetical protein